MTATTNDNFLNGPIDPRIFRETATEIWQLTLSYLPIPEVLQFPLVCKYFNEDVVWHPRTSWALLWMETNLEAKVCGTTVLIHACYDNAPNNHITTLIKARADVNAVDETKKTALYWASSFGRDTIVKKLIEAGANPNTTNELSPLAVACNNNYVSTVKELVGCSRTDINYADSWGITPLMIACLKNNVYIIRILVKAGANVHINDSFGNTAHSIIYNRLNDPRYDEETKLSMHYQEMMDILESAQN